MSKRAAAVLALICSALIPAAARASAYTNVLHAYQADGSVPACQFSSPQLAVALRGVDAYGQQYFADFSDAVQSALAQRAAGACVPGSRRSAAKGESLPPAPLPASVTSPTAGGAPLPIVLMAALALLLALSAAAGALARGLGWSPSWAAAWRHAWGEAGFRSAAVWSDVTDWLGRRR